ncbi:50S ribosomal protein L30 [Candidatus Pacearchaeota archaeon]|nr:50S ribosomal protein L30 [Candidatus Pacearchaeota archaeon]
MIVLIRITGLVNMNLRVEETLSRLRLRRKFSCVVIKETPENLGMLQKVRNFVAFGKINEATLAKLIEARAEKIGDSKAKITGSDKIAKEVMAGKGLEELGIKPFFRLHPPRGGIKSKLQYPRGVLGDHKENINKLIEKML